MLKSRIKSRDGSHGLVDAVLKHPHGPLQLLPLPQYACDLANFVFYGPIFWMIQRPSNNTEPPRTLSSRYCLMDVRRVVGSQVIPQKNTVVIRPLQSKLLYFRANMITEIPKDIDCCPHPLDAPNPTPWTLDTSTYFWGKGSIPPNNCIAHCQL